MGPLFSNNLFFGFPENLFEVAVSSAVKVESRTDIPLQRFTDSNA